MTSYIEKARLDGVDHPLVSTLSAIADYVLYFRQKRKFHFMSSDFAVVVPNGDDLTQVSFAVNEIQKVMLNMLHAAEGDDTGTKQILAVWRDVEVIASDYLCGTGSLVSIVCLDGTKKDYRIRYSYTAPAPGEPIGDHYLHRNRHEKGDFVVCSRHTGRVSKEPVEIPVSWHGSYQAAKNALIRHLLRLKNVRFLPHGELIPKISRIRATNRGL